MTARLPLVLRWAIYSLSAVLRGVPGVERCLAHGWVDGESHACVFASHNRHTTPCSWDMWWRKT